ncbi:MAG TPA: ABC transporter permease [Pseudolabrys sp.]|nr:ABC transporter permease [Pseudolabrys sp.]
MNAVQVDTLRQATSASAERFGADVIAGLREWSLWTMLGWNDIRQRYRRSVLGPFWITLSVGVFIFALGIIYSRIFKTEIATYLPYLSLGYILWSFISQTVNESCQTYAESERILKQIRLPYSMYVFRVVWRNFLVFLHTIGLYIPIALIFGIKPGFDAFIAVLGFAVLYVNLLWVSLVISILCARFRDVVQIISTLLQIMLFATPIMYPASALGSAQIIADINPLYHILDIVRAPLLGSSPALLSWVVSLSLAVIGSVAAMLLLRRAGRRIVFWL